MRLTGLRPDGCVLPVFIGSCGDVSERQECFPLLQGQRPVHRPDDDRPTGPSRWVPVDAVDVSAMLVDVTSVGPVLTMVPVTGRFLYGRRSVPVSTFLI